LVKANKEQEEAGIALLRRCEQLVAN